MKKRVRIKVAPKAQSGAEIKMRPGLGFNSNTLNWPIQAGKLSEPDIEVNSTLKPVKREDANVEAEGGETVVTNMTGDGVPELYKVRGPRHSAGGTPLNLPDDSFVFSDTKKMKIKDPDILNQFGITNKKGGITPGDISKKYDINYYKGILANPDSDKLQISTAETMISNYNLKLAKLGLAQESMKGFPQGIPTIAMPFIEASGINPTSLLGIDDQVEQQADENILKFGGGTWPQYGGWANHNANKTYMDNGGSNKEKPWASKTTAGKTTPTGRISDSPFETVEEWQAAREAKGLKNRTHNSTESQSELYDVADPYWKAMMWGRYGDTNQGASKNKFQKWTPNKGETYTQFKERMIESGYTPEKIKAETDPLKKSFTDSKSGAREAWLLTTPQEDQPIEEGEKEQRTVAAAPLKAEHAAPVAMGDYAPWWRQDVVKTTGAAGDFFRIEEYAPYTAIPGTHEPDVALLSPERALAANTEQANLMSQYLSSFSGPQRSGQMSEMAGKAAANAANIISDTQNRNVAIYNAHEGELSNIRNSASREKAGLKTQDWDKHTIMNQQFDNSRNMARQNLRQSYIDAVTNKNYTANLNMMNPQYAVDPSIGGKMFFHDPRALEADMSKEEDNFSKWQKAYDKYPSLREKPELIAKLLGLDIEESKSPGRKTPISYPGMG